MQNDSKETVMWGQVIARVFLGGLFIWAGTAKLLSLDDFVEVVGNYEIEPFSNQPWDMWLGYMLPSFEIILGISLIVGYFLRGGSLVASLLILCFFAATLYVKANDINIECGCFGEVLKVSYWVHLAILLSMLIAALLIMKSLCKSSSATQPL